jgi:alpha-L-fucosidase 2
MQAGKIEFVQVKSQVGGECRLRNPRLGATVALERDGSQAQDFSGDLLRFATTKGEVIAIHPHR